MRGARMRRAFYAAMIISFARKLLRKTLAPAGISRVESRHGDTPRECAMFLYRGSTFNYRIGGKFMVGGRTSWDVNDRLCARYEHRAMALGYHIGFYSTRKDDVVLGYPDDITSPKMMNFLNEAFDFVLKIVPKDCKRSF